MPSIKRSHKTNRLAFAVFVLLSAPFAHADPAPASLRYTSDFPADQKQLIELDISRITTPSFELSNPTVMKLFEQQNPVTPNALKAWLFERVKILVAGSYEYSTDNFNYVSTSYKFPLAGLFPKDNRDAQILNTQVQLSSADATAATTAEDRTPVEAMSNIGAAAYADSKTSNRGLRSLQFPGIGSIVIGSPRVGLVQIDKAVFPDQANPQRLATYSNSILRLSLLFHEGRHSDGNGRTQGFFHVICPAGSPYKGLPACDSSLNGAYTVGGQILKAYTESCTVCSVANREALRTIYLDSFARVLRQMPIAKLHAPDELAKLVSICDQMKAKNMKESAECPLWRIESDAALAHRPPTRSTLEWDDAPEGQLSN